MLPILTSRGVWIYLPTLCLPDLIARANFWLMLSVVLPFFPILLPIKQKGSSQYKIQEHHNCARCTGGPELLSPFLVGWIKKGLQLLSHLTDDVANHLLFSSTFIND